MTLLPAELPGINPVVGPPYKVGPLCEAPGCRRPVDHAHHLWRRSFFTGRHKATQDRKGDYWWVELPGDDPLDKVVIGNVVGLCWRHHDDVTGNLGGHRARYLWQDGMLFWQRLDGAPFDDDSLKAVLTRPFDGTYEAPVTEPERCPSCGRRKTAKREKLPRRERRRRVRFQFDVPQDTEEDGYALIVSVIDDCAERLGRSENETYYTLADVCNWFLLNYDPAEDAA